MARASRDPNFTPGARPHLPMFLVAVVLLGSLSGCAIHFNRAKALEAQNRWEEASIEYRLAYLEEPGDNEYREALERANKVVARENLALYKEYLAKKQFRKAHRRLVDTLRQDPELAEAGREMAKWLRVLIAGQVRFEFDSLRANLALADEIFLTARLNTPNPGEVIEAEIDLAEGTFFAENLLYDRPSQMAAYYSLNAIGVTLVYSRNKARKFSTRNFQRFVNFRAPVLEGIRGDFETNRDGGLTAVGEHRLRGSRLRAGGSYWQPPANPHYSLEIQGSLILVTAREGEFHFTPRFLYLNRSDQRLFVDFGRYEVKLDPASRRWGLARLPLGEGDYFPAFSQNIALQPYFFYREGVYTYAPAGAG
ncbi:MAG: hypothetical protein V3S29_14695 [bacterium]